MYPAHRSTGAGVCSQTCTLATAVIRLNNRTLIRFLLDAHGYKILGALTGPDGRVNGTGILATLFTQLTKSATVAVGMVYVYNAANPDTWAAA